ncbi:MAG: tRNA threonylcarbamoyladenosine dehydratase [Ruminococcaceae bacterium]|nr:tRNA threonylcarbamoyladenosine dehydratase [Oscillospiraceae bacterium]
MAEEFYSRTAMLLGEDGVERLKNSTVAVFGLGGVGSYILEALVRAGVGHLILVDGDSVAESNLNRQLIATTDTVGMRKVDAAAARARSINPSIELELYDMFYTAENADSIDLTGTDYVCDAIDSVRSKMELVARCRDADIPLICCLGTGNKLDPTRLEISDIYKTDVCPLAREIRRLCRKEGVKSLKVLYSKEEPVIPKLPPVAEDSGIVRRTTPGSVSFVPSAAGLIIAGEVIRHICR